MNRYLLFLLVLLSLPACRKQAQRGDQSEDGQLRVYGRYVPERKDDFAWENEYAAFRMYGPALKPENPSNGVDLWLKNSPALVIDTMYGRELKDHRPYHINYDGNLDCYKVAHTCGAGGLVVLTADGEGTNGEGYRTWIGGPYDRWEILEQKPDRFVFRLEYDSLLVAGQIFHKSLTITAEAGQLQNKAEVVLTSAQPSATGSQLLAGGGIYLHDTVDYYMTIPEVGYVFYEEDALSDKQAAQMNYEYNGSTSQGRIQISVKTPGATLTDIVDGNLIAVKPYELGDTLTYYFGATWSKWSDTPPAPLSEGRK